jgi:hypothetical protein
MSGQISRLTTVAHILYDREVLELRQENERLHRENERLCQENERLIREIQEFKLEQFWKLNDPERLRFAMFCYKSRHPNLASDNVNAWVEPMLQNCGLEIESVYNQLTFYVSQQSDLDTHIVYSSPFTFVAYGTKLWKAKSVDDPEICKLKALFDALNV